MPKRRKLDPTATAAALTAAAIADEAPAAFSTEHYGALGLNGRFEASDAIAFFAGSESGGGGMFESAETRDIASAIEPLLDVFRSHGLRKGASVLDVGAGTGLMLQPLSDAVGPDGTVRAVDLSARFVAFLKRRAERHAAHSATLSTATPPP